MVDTVPVIMYLTKLLKLRADLWPATVASLVVKEAVHMNMDTEFEAELSVLPPPFSGESTTTLTIKTIYKIT